MTRRGVLLLTLLAVALTGFSLALSRRDSHAWRANRSRRLFPFPWRDAVSIEVRKTDGSAMRFEKGAGGEWLLRLPDDIVDAVDNQAVDAFSALATLTWREPMRDGAAPDPERAVKLTAADSTGRRVELAFGETSGNLRAVTVDGDAGAVFGVNQDLLKFLEWPPDRFRKYTLAGAGTGVRPSRVALSPGGADEALRIELLRTPKGWRMVRPTAWRVDETRLDLLLIWLDRLRADSIAAEYSADLEWFGFTPESAFIEVRYDAPGGEGSLSRRIEFGGDAGDGNVYARETSRPPIFIVSGEALREISLDSAASHPDLWRNFYRLHSINAVGSGLPAEIVVERLLPAPARLTVTQTRERDLVKWMGVLEEGGARRSFAVDPPDAGEPMRPLTALLTGLSGIRARSFLADAAPGTDTARWTAFPAWRFTVTESDGTVRPEVVVYAGGAEGRLPPGEPFRESAAGPLEMSRDGESPGIAFSVADLPAVMEMHGEQAYLLCLPPYRYQTRRVNDYDSRRWTRVEIVAGGKTVAYTRRPGEINEQWWQGEDSPRPLMDDNNLFVGLLLELSQLRTEGFVAGAEADGKEFGLDRPMITAIVYVAAKEGEKGEQLFSLTVGGADASGKSRFARLDDGGPVFLVPERLAEGLAGTYK